ncbi:winged helix-turn-helix transcriptional regulator [Clavibacter tessellarius]|uniref:Transcriptional regulator n=1 Tax=Clavibacter tessellarius TaxID=31965 RepID=A0A225CR34_9MICO|nr:metalloregulator ArsR/SmtB family transcription factor [Clavibacter michiganensis]MBT1636921.1 winged helix-turn-helix domain-containing protein [Clavibacter michiganensis]OQJ64172.1 transcriptional regulator [Clavibacter michiganensis subsp. tessellarius]UKF32857.1 winged helix-turn-helix transcriptional regulator [Clavibacter michiganensis subsp. tessellarius]
MPTLAPRLDVMTRLGRALADPTRSRILVELLAGPAYPALLAESLGLTRQNVSNHLGCLRGCGIVRTVPEGRSTRYEIADPRIARGLGTLVEVVLAVEEDRACADPSLCAPDCCEPRA